MKFILFVLIIFSFKSFSQELRGTWLARNSLSSKEALAAAMDSLAANNFNIVYVNAWSRGYPLWQSDVFFAETGIKIDPNFQNRDILKEAVAEAHKHGLNVEAWFEYGFVGGWTGNLPPNKKGPIFENHPNWIAKKLDGTEIDNSNFYWMIHTRKDVQDFLIKLTLEVVRNYDLDGIELDRIRYSSLEYGYDSYTDSLYKSEHNGNAPPQNISDTTWIRWRANKLNDFMARTFDSVKTLNPKFNVSNAPSLYSSNYYTSYFSFCQDWVWWINNNKIDNVQVQSYLSSSSTFASVLDYISTLVNNKQKVFPAFATMPNGNPISINEALNFVNITRQKNFKGNAIWYYTDLKNYFSTLKSNVYLNKTHLPFTSSNWREYFKIVKISDTINALRFGNWKNSSIFGYSGNSVFVNNQDSASIKYYFDVPASGYYEVYIFNIVADGRTDSALYYVYDKDGNKKNFYINQMSSDYKRFIKLGDFYYNQGRKLIVEISNKNLMANQLLGADASMIILNRKLSPDASTKIEEKKNFKKKEDFKFSLKSFPNPFNSDTHISFFASNKAPHQIKLFTILGEQLIEKNIIPDKIGLNDFTINFQNFISGIYFLSITNEQSSETIKLILTK